MARQVVSRTQRRMEKRHALMVLALLLVASLVSFSLGVMVGKGGNPEVVVEEQMPQQKPAQVAAAETAPSPEAVPAEVPADAELTFYDTLPRGQENALGSGINLPPEEEKPREQPVDKLASRRPASKLVTTPAATEPALPAEVGTLAVKPEAEKPAVKKPLPAAGGSFIIQVASIKDRQGADALRAQMAAKGYAAYVEEADLGAKGIWYRIFAGPYGSQEAADKTIASLKADKISSAPLLKRR